MIQTVELSNKLETESRVWMRQAVSFEELAQIEKYLPTLSQHGGRQPVGGPLGTFINNCDFANQIRQLWPGMRVVRLVSFEKNPGANWSVPWHQDRIVSVDRKADVEGYSNWSKKSGVWHCEPPVDILDKMLFVRLHLDENTAENGAMEIACGSHCEGLVRSQDAENKAKRYRTEFTEAGPGDILILKMLTLHRAPPSHSDESRRALRIDFAADGLAPPLSWAD